MVQIPEKEKHYVFIIPGFTSALYLDLGPDI